MDKKLPFDEWCAEHGGFFNDQDDAARKARLMAAQAFCAGLQYMLTRWQVATLDRLGEKNDASPS